MRARSARPRPARAAQFTPTALTEWDTSKENAQPLRAAAAARRSRRCTPAPLDAASGKNDAARDAWEAEIKTSAGGADPLDTWRRYLQWTREA